MPCPPVPPQVCDIRALEKRRATAQRCGDGGRRDRVVLQSRFRPFRRGNRGHYLSEGHSMLRSVLVRRAAKVLAPLTVAALVVGCGETNQTAEFPKVESPPPVPAPAAKTPLKPGERVGSEQGV